MKTIAFDTSNQPLSVALFDEEQLIAQRETNVPKNHSIQLLALIDEIVTAAGWQPTDLDQVVVSQGPGSYTGLRIAVTTAKTLAFTLNLRLIGISSLALLAANETTADALIIPIMDARNDNLYAGGYVRTDNGLKNVFVDGHTNITRLLAQLETVTQPIIFVGEWARFAEQFKAALPTARFSEDNLPHAVHAQMLAQAAPVITDMAAIHQFVPNYYRLSQAEADWAKANPNVMNDNYVEKL